MLDIFIGVIAAITVQVLLLNTEIKWWVLLIIMLGVLFIAVLVIYWRIIRKQRKVLIIICSYFNHSFFSNYLGHLLKNMNNNKYRTEVKISSENYNYTSLIKEIKKAKKYKKYYLGAIIVPVCDYNGEKDMYDLLRDFNKPTVLVDCKPKWNSFPEKVSFVGYDNKEGGQKAAKALAEQLEIRDIDKPTILVISGSSQDERKDCFVEIIRQRIKECNIIVDDGGRYDRHKAKDIAICQLKKNRYNINAIYCTSDNMVLGAYDAVCLFENEFNDNLPMLIGYDGLEETIAMMSRNDKYLLCEIIQDTERMALETAIEFNRLLKGERNSIKNLEPKIMR